MRYIVGFLIALGLIVLVFILILKTFNSSSNVKPPTPLISYAGTNVEAELTIAGPITADQTHQALQIIVSQNLNTINIIHGYQGTVTQTQTFPNNQAAYAVFLRAIDIAGFSQGGQPNATANDQRGYCPEGNSYVYQIKNGSRDIEHYWSTSCGNLGTFKGNVSVVNTLFEQQIPNLNILTANLNF